MPGLVPIGDFNGASDGTMAFNTNQAGSQFRAALSSLLSSVAADIISDDPTVVAAAVDAVEQALVDSKIVQYANTTTGWRVANEDGTVGFELTRAGFTRLGRSADGDFVAEYDGRMPTRGGRSTGFRFVDMSSGAVLAALDRSGMWHSETVCERVIVHLIMGQSNARGQGYPLAPRLDHGNRNVLIWSWPFEELWPMQTPTVTSGGRAGVSLADELPFLSTERLDERTRVVTINAGVGATSLLPSNDSTNGNWNVGYSGANPHLFQRAMDGWTAAVEQVQARFPRATIETWAWWHQGEGNSHEDDYAGYLDALLDLIDATRTHIGDPSAPFTIGGMVPEHIATTASGHLIRQNHIEAQTLREHVAYADGIVNGGDSQGPTDTAHYSRQAMERLARAMWDAGRRAAAATADSVPQKPLDVTAQRVGSEVTVSWSAPMCRFTSFTVEWSTDQVTWTTLTRAIPADQSETFTTTATDTDPVYVRVTTHNTGASVTASNPTTPTLALRG